MGGIEARSGEMMGALMGMWRTTKPPQPQYHSAQNASASMLSDDYCCKNPEYHEQKPVSTSFLCMTMQPYLKADMTPLWLNW